MAIVKEYLKQLLGPAHKPISRMLFRMKMICIDTLMKRKNYILKLNNIKSLFYLPYIKTDGIQQGIYFGGNYYEWKILDYIFDKWNNSEVRKAIENECVLDIGANIGNHSLYFLNECNARFVFSFEPARDTFEILEKNINLNHLENKSKLFNVGVGSKAGTAVITGKYKDTAFTKLLRDDEGDIPLVAIDDLNIQERISLVKIDVEGFELEAIKGMISLLRKDKPYVMIEIWRHNYNEVFKTLKNIGYDCETIDESESMGDYLFYIK